MFSGSYFVETSYKYNSTFSTFSAFRGTKNKSLLIAIILYESLLGESVKRMCGTGNKV